MDKSKIIGKKAKVVCLTEQLKSISIHDVLPGTIVTIQSYDCDHIVYGELFKVYDGIGDSKWSYIIPLKWLEIQN